MNSYRINGKTADLVKQDWKFLVILDACRYDCFKEVYKNILGDVGELKKAKSPASWTMEWLNKQFSDYYEDIIYISSNPYINSGSEIKIHGLSYNGKKHFYKVVDVWKKWDEKTGTVLPLEINKAFHRVYIKNPKKRFILHYLQPHRPYISLGGGKSTLLEAKYKLEGKKEETKTKNIKNILANLLTEVQAWELKKLIGKPPSSKEEELYRKKGKKGTIEIYKQEIKIVLKNVKMLIDSISGRWIITSDHGERICSFWSHYSHNGRHDSSVTEVPYFVIDNQ